MNRIQPPYAGSATAAAFVVDVGLVGEAEARTRVLDEWKPGASLRLLRPNAWLLILSEPRSVSCHAAPGLPLEAVGGGLAPAGSHEGPKPGFVRTLEGGVWSDRPIADLDRLEPWSWIDLGSLSVHHLNPLQSAAPSATRLEPPTQAPVVDLRSAAKVGPRGAKADEVASDLAQPRRVKNRRSGGGGAAAATGRGTIARLLMRSPAAPLIGRKHAKYLKSLTDAFERRQYDDALRDAIAVGGGGGFTTLRLPRRRAEVSGPSTKRADGGSIPWGPTVQQHLTNLYRSAATQLELDGRIDEAAFVLSDLMGNALGAVSLLERHSRLELAAEIADGRMLAADLVVRLRWRAGHRARALEVARARGAYAEAIKRLEPVDPEAAQELRVAWSADLGRAGDYLGAVEAVWPVEELRSTVIPDIQAGMALGGPTAAYLFAYLLATDERGAGSDAGLALLRTRDPALLASRERFITALSRLRCADPVTDRVLATATIRELLTQEARPDWHEQALRQAFNALSERADPVLRADLPPLGWHKAGGSSQRPLQVVAAAQPGQLPVLDVAALDGGVLLVAFGNHGARLLTLDGKTRASWDIPTHRLVVADHGGIALLANYVGDLTWEFHRLDLLTRRTSRWITIRISHFDPTFDGITLTVIDEDGALVFLDAQADRPKVLWRELDGVGRAVALARSPGRLAAVVQTRTGPGLPAEHLEQWSWDLPSMTLRGRPHVDWPTSQSTLTSAGVFTSLDVGDQDESAQRWEMRSIDRGSRQSPVTLETTGPVRITSSGLLRAVIFNEPDVTRVQVTTSKGDDDLIFTFPADVQPQVRSHGGSVAVWDQAGRIVSVDTIGRRVTCSIRTRL